MLAQWRDGNQLHTERVTSVATVEAGASLTLWVDRAGRVVAAPLTTTDAKVSAIGVATTIWLLLVVFSGLTALGIRTGLDRSRARSWERELQLLAHNDDGWANRRT